MKSDAEVLVQKLHFFEDRWRFVAARGASIAAEAR